MSKPYKNLRKKCNKNKKDDKGIKSARLYAYLSSRKKQNIGNVSTHRPSSQIRTASFIILLKGLNLSFKSLAFHLLQISCANFLSKMPYFAVCNDFIISLNNAKHR